MTQLGELLDELDMEIWLGHEGIRHKLTRGTRGLQANIRECPCCGNTKWKVYFGLETGLGNCFVCDEKFTKWKFIKAHLNVASADAARYLENYMRTQGWAPRQTASAPVQMKAELKIPTSLPIPINGRNLKYLENRGIDTELAKYFHLRYCHHGVFRYTDAYGRPAEQDYSGRVIVPVFDLDGKLVSFQGRDIAGTSTKKYLFPPGFASTGSVIYNGHNAWKAPRIVMGEGAFDAFATKLALDEDKVLREFTAVASFGKKLSDGDENSQMGKLKALQEKGALKEVVFIWDSEKEALEAAVDAALLVRRHGLGARIALLPKGRDPNEVPAQVVRDAVWKSVAVDAQIGIKLKLAARAL